MLLALRGMQIKFNCDPRALLAYLMQAHRLWKIEHCKSLCAIMYNDHYWKWIGMVNLQYESNDV